MDAIVDCPECERLKRIAIFQQRHDWRDGREAWAELARHKANDHVLHVAVPETNQNKHATNRDGYKVVINEGYE